MYGMTNTPTDFRTTLDLSGRVALVTGASGGIGANIALTLAKAGARVAIHYNRSREAAEIVAGAISTAGGTGMMLQADIGDEAARRLLYQHTVTGLDAPTILVHNAGLFERNPWCDEDGQFIQRWRRTLSINLEAAAHLTFLALPEMRKQKFGRIVMISSRAAFRGETDCADYAVSKAGMVNLARCLARSEGPHGITANSICPGWVETEMAKKDLVLRGLEIRTEIPLGRVATTDDVANAVLFFVSPMGSYANGTALGLNGGSFLH